METPPRYRQWTGVWWQKNYLFMTTIYLLVLTLCPFVPAVVFLLLAAKPRRTPDPKNYPEVIDHLLSMDYLKRKK